MTASNPNNAPPLSGAPSMRISPANIEQVDVLARKLYKRARVNPELEEVANAVRSLHAVLKHLKFETEDPGSLLNVDSSAVYARQLTPILEDSEFALKQLDTILDKKYGRGSDESADNVSRGMQMDGEKGWTVLESRERDMINLIHTKLTNQKLNIDMFLDTVQLHNPSKSHHLVDTNSANLDSIKDKVDFIASRICQRTNSNLSDGNEEELWEQFRDELEQAGFSKDVLRKNQDVIRAYIRQLDNQLSANGGSTPSVRGLLEYYRPRRDNGIQITPYPTNPTPADFSPEELQPNIDEEKLFPSMRMKRLEDEDDNNNIERQISKPPKMPNYPSNLSYDRHSSSGDGGDGSTALMSTRELMAFDKQSNMALAMENMHLQQPPNPAGSNYHMSISPTLHYLPPSASQPTLPSSAPQAAPDPFGTHLHRPPPLPSAAVSSPPTRRPNSVSVADVSQQQQQALVTSTQRNARLAPDSKGHEIPLDAKWTRISRRLVSPEVLAGAGVRYEARPDFVAVLGELSRDDVTYFAHRTTEVRAARGRRTSNTPTAATVISGDGVKGRKLDDKYHPDKYRNWDVIEAEKRERQRRKEGNKNSRDTDSDDDTDDDGVTFIVNNRSRRRRGSTASTVSALYDSSNDSGSSDGETDSDDRDQESHGSSYSQSYPRSSSYLDDYHHSRSQVHRRSSTMPSTSHKHDEKTLSQAKGRVNSDATDGIDRKNNKDRNERGAKAYPIIVSPPSSTIGKDKGKDKDTGTGTSPAATVKPKPILKNKNDDPHVRIDPHPQIIEEGSSSLPRSLPSYRRSERERRERDKDRDRERSRDRERDRDRDRENDRDREKRYRSDKHTTGGREKERHTDRDRDRDRDRGDRIREKEYYSNRDRDEGRDEYPHRHRHRSHGHRYHSSSAPRKERDREYYDDHYVSSSNRSREDRTSKKKARDETIRAVGLGGAAAAMLSMLSEATL